MAKNHQTENPLYKALMKRAEAEIATAIASLIVYFDTPTAGKSLKEMEHLLNTTSAAEQRIETLNKHFNNTQI